MKEKNLYYEKVKKYYWSIYEVKGDDLKNIDGFESLEDLNEWINDNIGEMSKDNLYNYISHRITLKDKYIIIKDKIDDFEALENREF